MRSDHIALRIQGDLGNTWARDTPLPNEVVAELCDAMWQEGITPIGRNVQQKLKLWNEHALGPGIAAWRTQKGLSRWGTGVGNHAVPTNLEELAKLVSPDIASAPLTAFDKTGNGRWAAPAQNILAYMGKIQNQSLRRYPCPVCTS